MDLVVARRDLALWINKESAITALSGEILIASEPT